MMKRKPLRFTSFLLSLMLIFSSLSTAAFTAYAESSGGSTATPSNASRASVSDEKDDIEIDNNEIDNNEINNNEKDDNKKDDLTEEETELPDGKVGGNETADTEIPENTLKTAGMKSTSLRKTVSVRLDVELFTVEDNGSNESVVYNGKTYYPMWDIPFFYLDQGYTIEDKNALIELINNHEYYDFDITDIEAVFDIVMTGNTYNYPLTKQRTFPITINPNYYDYDGEPLLELFAICSREEPEPPVQHKITATLTPPEAGDTCENDNAKPKLSFNYNSSNTLEEASIGYWYESEDARNEGGEVFSGTFEAGKTYYSEVTVFPTPLRQDYDGNDFTDIDTVEFTMAGGATVTDEYNTHGSSGY